MSDEREQQDEQQGGQHDGGTGVDGSRIPDDTQHREFDEDGHAQEGTILDEGGVDTDERAGRSQGIDTDSEPDEETAQEMEEERERRLDPENRPENAEVDNTQRDFDVDHGKFTDRDDYDESEEGPYAEGDDDGGSDDSGSTDEDDTDSDDDK